MKFNSRLKVVVLVSFLLVLLSVGISVSNYLSGFEQTRRQLRESSLPLSTDNIYADIQKIIIEPSLISSMMANDTFVHDWFSHENDSQEQIIKYLNTIKNKYGFYNTFLVSTQTLKYYTADGFLEVLSREKKDNAWYFRFSSEPPHHEINIDTNALIDNSLMLFFNYKIFNERNQLLGVVGVVFKTSYISSMFKRFREFYKLNVYLCDHEGTVTLSEQGINGERKVISKKKMNDIFPLLANRKSGIIDYEDDQGQYIIKSKYVDELGQYLIVEAALEKFTGELQHQLAVNLMLSLFVTIVVTLIILRTVLHYTRQLNKFAHHDTLTDLPNRRTFNENFMNIWNNYQRKHQDTCLVLFDIDDFKVINDTYGHQVGDKVLVRISNILQKQVRKTDYVSRWGGEEFSILLVNTDVDKAEQVAGKIRRSLEGDPVLRTIIESGITASFGVTAFTLTDSIKDIIDRSDVALYKAKQAGKNCVRVS